VAFAHQLSEVLPPRLQQGFVDVQAFAQFVFGLHDQVDMRVFLIGMEGPSRIDASGSWSGRSSWQPRDLSGGRAPAGQV
jgi:hypothetical protein